MTRWIVKGSWYRLRSNDGLIATPPLTRPPLDQARGGPGLGQEPGLGHACRPGAGLDPDGEADRPRPDARAPQLIVVELAVRRAGGMNDQALGIADVGEMR